MIKLSGSKVIQYLFFFLLLLAYFIHLGYNDIWNPNEGFYADCVRNMLETGNFLDFYFNGELRFNKPPMTYWAMAVSAWLFGLNEFFLRFPIILFTIGSVWLTYLTGKKIYNQHAGFISALAMALSLQFLANSRYATPEVPLTFFFTLTMYWFIKGYLDKSSRYLYLSYVALGLTILTKGFPYLIIIPAIIIFYIFLKANFKLKQTWKELWSLKVHIGIPVATIIGFSWLFYSYMKFGDEFLEILSRETLERAFSPDDDNSLVAVLFYFPSVMVWGFLPYSIVFYTGFFFFILKKKLLQENAFAISWFLVMIVIFSVARFKLPTYIIQAHPAAALIVGVFLARFHTLDKFYKISSNIGLLLPAIGGVIINVAIIVVFELHPIFHLINLIPVFFFIYLSSAGKKYLPYWRNDRKPYYQALVYFPFMVFVFTTIIFGYRVLWKLEEVRPYSLIGQVVNEHLPNKQQPLFIEDRFIFNMPYYAERKVFVRKDIHEIKKYAESHECISLIKTENIHLFPRAEILWEGYVYKRSEAVFFIFLQNYTRFNEGNRAKFFHYYLIYQSPMHVNKN